MTSLTHTRSETISTIWDQYFVPTQNRSGYHTTVPVLGCSLQGHEDWVLTKPDSGAMVFAVEHKAPIDVLLCKPYSMWDAVSLQFFPHADTKISKHWFAFKKNEILYGDGILEHPINMKKIMVYDPEREKPPGLSRIAMRNSNHGETAEVKSFILFREAKLRPKEK